MERLSLTSKVSYNASEAAVHLARYQLAAPYCQGRSVLDVACGEGYGAYALKQLGAKSIEGVDNSPQAVSNAQALFSKQDGIRFTRHDAENVDTLFPGRTFDLIVSLETIEHVQDPMRFLQSIKRLAHERTAIVISCPNDHWYYETEDQSNPHHVRKYSFEQFRDLTTGVLGNDAVWGFGIPVIGFGTVTDELTAGRDPLMGQMAMLDFRQLASSIALPPRLTSDIGFRNCSYFVGIWGGNAARLYTSAVVPISMDHYANLVSWEGVQISGELGLLQDKNRQLGLEKQKLEQQREYYRIQSLALSKEFDVVSSQFDGMRAKQDEYLEQLALLTKELEAATNSLEEARARADEQERKIGTLAGELDLLDTQAAALRAQRDEQDQRLAALTQELATVARDLEAANIRADELQLQRGEQEQRLAALTQEIATATHDLETTNAQVAALQAQRDQQERILDATHQEREFLRTQSHALTNELNQIKSTRAFRVVSGMKQGTVRAARRVKRYMPGPCLRFAQRIARAMGL